MALNWPEKDPEEVLDYPVNFADWLVSGATIANATCVIDVVTGDDSAAPLVIDAVQFAGSLVTVWTSGGVSGVKYQFKVTVEDNSGAPGPRIGVRRIKQTVKVK